MPRLPADRFKTAVATIAIAVALLAVGGCGSSAKNSQTSTDATVPAVMTTCQPLLEMARMTVGDSTAITVEAANPEGESARAWSPSRDEVERMRKAQKLLMQGAGYEPWEERISLKRSRMIDTAASYYDRFIRVPDAVTHQHGPKGSHTHPGTVWATWLDPQLAAMQLQTIVDELVELAPADEKEFTGNAAVMRSQLSALDVMVTELTEETAGKSVNVIGDGPYYQYLTQRLGWRLTYLHWPEPGTPLSAADIQELIDQFELAGDQLPALFLVRKEFTAEAEALAKQHGLILVPIDLTELASPDATVIDRWRGNLNRLQAAAAQLSVIAEIRE